MMTPLFPWLIMFNRFFIFYLLLGISAFLSSEEPFSLKKSFEKAAPGDFLVFSHNKNITLFHVFAKENNGFIIEEISAFSDVRDTFHSDWQRWINEGAPGHTSWVMYELHPEGKNRNLIYSFSQRNWQTLYPEEQIFPTLFSLKFHKIPDRKRKKAGPSPAPGEPDRRPPWNPPIFANGISIPSSCDAYEAVWPDDGSVLAGKKIEIYLPEDQDLFPTYFPFRIQIFNHLTSAKMRVIDSGKSFRSIRSGLPLLPPSLLTDHYSPEGDLIFQLKTDPKIKSFRVYAREKEGYELREIPHIEKEGPSSFTVRIANETILRLLDPEKSYYFSFEPDNRSDLRIETPKPLKPLMQHVSL